MNQIKLTGKKNKIFAGAVVMAFAVIVAIVAVLCFQYYVQVKDTVRSESESYILEISKQMGSNITRNINDNFSAIETIAVSLEMSESNTFETLRKKVEALKGHWSFKQVLVIDESTTSYDENGTPVRLNSDDYLQKAITDREPAMSASEMIGDKECVVFVIPVDFKINDKRIVALAATYELSTFDQVLSMNAFDGKGFAHIIRKNGTMVIRSSATAAFDAGYNVLNKLEEADFAGKQLDSVRQDILEEKSGFVEFLIEKESFFMSYIALDQSIDSGEWRLLTFVPVAEVNLKSTLLLKLTLILCGAITFTFAVLSTFIMLIAFRNKKRLERIAYVDRVTGGSTIQLFYEVAAKLLQNAQDSEFTLLYSNIEKFKLLNDQFGRKNCDNLLRGLNYAIGSDLSSRECIARLTADNFCILLMDTSKEDLIKRVANWKERHIQQAAEHNYMTLPFIMEFGCYTITDAEMPLAQIIDRAKLALTESSPVIIENIKISFYDENMRKLLVREKQLEDMMEQALLKEEFQVYLQPKFNTATEKIGGAEALVRWQSASEGMIYPNEFIPLFEKNGFIRKLDYFVFEKVCETLRRWIDEGKKPVKISVNCSRAHLKSKNFIAKYERIADAYEIDRGLIEIEFTENLVFGDVELFTYIIGRVRRAGFGCSMDDFGSGYSSLSLIQDIPVDTIKFDKVFFRSRPGQSTDRMESVVASVIKMSKALSMTTVAEGVEEKMHVDMLKRLGCDLIQGFYFAKPMPIPEFEVMAFGGGKEDNA